MHRSANLTSPIAGCAHPRCAYVSRARETRLDTHAPKPLRSQDFPDGLPELNQPERKQVDLANALYDLASRIILLCDKLHKRWSLEQPARSLFWRTSFWCKVRNQVQVVLVHFDHCMYGSSGRRRTCVATNVPELLEVELQCDGSTSIPRGVALNLALRQRQKSNIPLPYAVLGLSCCATPCLTLRSVNGPLSSHLTRRPAQQQADKPKLPVP